MMSDGEVLRGGDLSSILRHILENIDIYFLHIYCVCVYTYIYIYTYICRIYIEYIY
jgi:hypothetical protein